MAKEKKFPAKIVRENYVFRGRKIPVGTVVQVTEAQFASMTRMKPPYAERVEAPTQAAPIETAGEEIAAPKAAGPKPAKK
jgi:hypothetical protein